MLSVAPQPGKVKRAQLCDGYRIRTSGVCKGRKKAGPCLCVDLVADAEHCRPWCDRLRSSRSLTSYVVIWVCLKQNCPLVRTQTVSQSLQEEKEAVWRCKPRGNGESNDSPTIRSSASNLRVDRPCAAHDACSSDHPRPLALICLLFCHIKELEELGILTPRMELPHIASVSLFTKHPLIDLIDVRYRVEVPNTTYLQHGDGIHKPWSSGL